jgi:hypothetical protein
MFVNSSFFAFMHFFVLMLNEPAFDSDATNDKNCRRFFVKTFCLRQERSGLIS